MVLYFDLKLRNSKYSLLRFELRSSFDHIYIKQLNPNIFKAEQIREDDLEGIREHTTKQITTLEEKIVGLQVESQRQDEIIENKLRSVIPFYISSEKGL